MREDDCFLHAASLELRTLNPGRHISLSADTFYCCSETSVRHAYIMFVCARACVIDPLLTRAGQDRLLLTFCLRHVTYIAHCTPAGRVLDCDEIMTSIYLMAPAAACYCCPARVCCRYQFLFCVCFLMVSRQGTLRCFLQPLKLSIGPHPLSKKTSRPTSVFED